MDSHLDTKQAFPTKQLFLLGLCRIAEPIALTSVFPYAYDLMQHLVADGSPQAATYAGLFLAVFSLAETLTGFWWGSLSDKIGRKLVILLGLGGTIISLLLLGFSSNIWMAIFARLLGGALNGNTGVVQTMVGEIVVHSEHEARAYAIIPFFFSIGCTIGPALGGFFAGPGAAGLPLISNVLLFARYPFLLPNLVCASLVALTILLASLSLEETHPRKRKLGSKYKTDHQQFDRSVRAPLLGNDDVERDGHTTTNTKLPSTWNSLLRCLRGKVWKPIVAVCLLSSHTVTYVQLLPIFLRDPKDVTVPQYYFGGVGGLDVSLREAGFIMGLNGIIGLLAQLVFPFFTDAVGIDKTLLMMSTLHPLSYFSLPYIAFLPEGVWIYVSLYTWLTLRNIFSAFTYAILLIYVRRWTPDPLMLGQVNGLVASASAGCRTVSPVVAGLLQTVGQTNHLSALAWWASGLLALTAAVVTWSFDTAIFLFATFIYIGNRIAFKLIALLLSLLDMLSETSPSRIVQLAQSIFAQTTIVDNHIRENHLPHPSFEEDGPIEVLPHPTEDVKLAKQGLVEALIELQQLIQGPMELLLPQPNLSPIVCVQRYKMATLVPIGSTISFAELAAGSSLLECDVKRIVRFTATHYRIFKKPSKGFVAHTAASRMLAENPRAKALMALTWDEYWPAYNRVVEAVVLQSNKPNVTGYALANNTSQNMFEFFSCNPSRAQLFARVMGLASSASLEALATLFDWGSLPPNSKVVDLAGSRGHVSAYLAKLHPNLRFIVQDLPEVIEGAEKDIPAETKGRVEFCVHDMFSKQLVKDVDVFLLQFVLHDWSDENCVFILRNLIPSLKAGAKIVLQEHLLPDPGTMSLTQERNMRSMDATMLTLFNSREREAGEWEDLLQTADPRFQSFTAKRFGRNGSTGVISTEWAP